MSETQKSSPMSEHFEKNTTYTMGVCEIRITDCLNNIMAWVRHEHDRRIGNSNPVDARDKPFTARELHKFRDKLDMLVHQCHTMIAVLETPEWEDGEPHCSDFLKELNKDVLKIALPFPDCLKTRLHTEKASVIIARLANHYMPSLCDDPVFHRYCFTVMPNTDGKCFQMRDDQIERIWTDLNNYTHYIASAMFHKFIDMSDIY